jgi:hypothetical protein
MPTEESVLHAQLLEQRGKQGEIPSMNGVGRERGM